MIEELKEKLKLSENKVDELEKKVDFLKEVNEDLEEENQELRDEIEELREPKYSSFDDIYKKQFFDEYKDFFTPWEMEDIFKMAHKLKYGK